MLSGEQCSDTHTPLEFPRATEVDGERCKFSSTLSLTRRSSQKLVSRDYAKKSLSHRLVHHGRLQCSICAPSTCCTPIAMSVSSITFSQVHSIKAASLCVSGADGGLRSKDSYTLLPTRIRCYIKTEEKSAILVVSCIVDFSPPVPSVCLDFLNTIRIISKRGYCSRFLLFRTVSTNFSSLVIRNSHLLHIGVIVCSSQFPLSRKVSSIFSSVIITAYSSSVNSSVPADSRFSKCKHHFFCPLSLVIQNLLLHISSHV